MATQREVIKWIPGTTFLVDGFNYASHKCTAYFLTHMHGDHTTGLTRRFAGAPIYCSPLTAELLRKDWGLRPSVALVALPVGRETVVQGVGVTPLDANHCPGAVMLLFRVPKAGGGDAVLLHTGDMRWQSWMADQPALRGLRIDVLFLDTTYCMPRYTFPPQDAAIQAIVRLCMQHDREPGTLFVVAAYHIGKERAYLGAATALGWRLWAPPAKRKTLDLLPLTDRERALLVDDAAKARIHVSPMGADMRPEALAERAAAGGWQRVVAFRPTGWAFRKNGGLERRLACGGRVALYGIPYSEHSSWTELRDCVKRLRPARIVPTVNADTPARSAAIVDRFADLMDLSGHRGRMDMYLCKRKREDAGGAVAGPVADAVAAPPAALQALSAVAAAATPAAPVPCLACGASCCCCAESWDGGGCDDGGGGDGGAFEGWDSYPPDEPSSHFDFDDGPAALPTPASESQPAPRVAAHGARSALAAAAPSAWRPGACSAAASAALRGGPLEGDVDLASVDVEEQRRILSAIQAQPQPQRRSVPQAAGAGGKRQALLASFFVRAAP